MPALTARWRKSTRSGENGGCVEARAINGNAEVRDSKDQAGPVLSFDHTTWRELIAAIKRGEIR